MQDAGYGLRRIILPRTPVNRGKREGPEPTKTPAPDASRVAARYARGGLRTLRRSVLPSSLTTSSVVSRVQMCLIRLERLTFTSVLDRVS